MHLQLQSLIRELILKFKHMIILKITIGPNEMKESVLANNFAMWQINFICRTPPKKPQNQPTNQTNK